MPWSDKSDDDHDSKSGQKPGPWGAPPPSSGGGAGGGSGGNSGGSGGGGNEPPPRRPNNGPRRPNPSVTPDDLTEIWRKLRQRFGGASGRFNPNLIGVAVAVVVFLWIVSGIYFVQPAEQAVVTTFGAYSGETGPGGHWRFVPFQHVEKVPTAAVQQIDIGGTPDNENLDESLMLTGDENIVNLTFRVQYRISDAYRYLFRVTDPTATIKAVAESAIREVVGKSKLQDITTSGRAAVQQQTAALMQQIVNRYGVGVTVDEVTILTATPPKEVLEDFQAVTSAGQYADSAVNEANTYRNRVINVAKGDAARRVQDAEAYREKVVDEAQGDASRFNQIYEQYKRAPAVTRERLYLESMERVLSHSNKVLVDTHGATAPIILPPDAFRPKSASDATAQASPAAQPTPAPVPPVVQPTPPSPGAGQ